MPTITCTCHTSDCMNEDIPIELPFDPEFGPPSAYCGPCGQPIEDVVISDDEAAT